ncbi:transcriptional regulator [Gluconacetobacter liquefaciens]|uniref:FMN-binding negative transcriptional regulator n=1 Tax=Gluconacetobacter liquefaciens TaxID=89584 RepID=A0A370FY07_GLULI|nr:FMN-binding negative transcriptional regulator [Gluconacetobacter liquefaciens]MBB2187382.1 FMN-binding negative transcriptional regulator [Gluconacetobacter liquefaciens]RDI36345.1 PaiB family negative transcriptional regulator [Gluconacetobacter liquefaciens]GBQ96020.1 transcriptional regulator [Gluconacetobacter liquefaciens NRIC 0522]GEB37899.1 transcriptional regulator [Gluconacetobacter liquefaciens]
MFAPPPYHVDDPQHLWPLIEGIRLGSVISVDDNGTIQVSHLPILLDRTRGRLGTLIGHLDIRNPHVSALDNGTETIVSFVGPDSGVSPDWYGTAPRVPTWLYVAVEARGRPVMIRSRDGVRDIVAKSSDLATGPHTTWRPDDVDAYIDRLLPAIVGFEIPVAHLVGQLRLGQQNSNDDRLRVMARLARGSLQQRRVARAMDGLASADHTLGLSDA